MDAEKFKQLSKKEQQEELKKCKESISYFYNNYCRKEGMPEYSEEQFEKYIQEVKQKRQFMDIKSRRFGPKPSYFDRLKLYSHYPLTTDEAFK